MILNFSLLLTTLLIVTSADPEKTSQQHLEDAKLHLSSGNTNLAFISYDSALNLVPDDYLTLFKRALLNLSLGRHSLAIKDFTKVLSIKPEHQQALLQRGKLLLEDGNIKQAHIDLSKYVSLYPNDTEAANLFAQLSTISQDIISANSFYNQKLWNEALEFFSKVLTVCPNDVTIRISRADCFLNTGSVEMALADYRRAVMIKPDNIELYLKISNLRLQIGEIQDALNSVKECLKLDPDQKKCKSEFKRLKKLAKEISSVDDAISKNKWLTARDMLLSNNGLVSKVEAMGSKSLKAKVYGYACKCFSGLAKNEDTLKWCSKALEIDPDQIDILVIRADAKILAEEYDDAVRDYQKAHEMNQSDRSIMEGLQKAQRLLRQAGRRDYYKILGVPRTATTREIKKAFRKLAQEWHPDKYRGDLPKDTVQKKMSAISEAYEVLSKEELRTRFDNGDDPNDQQQQQGNPFAGFQGGFPGGGFQFGGGGQQFHFKF